MKIAEVKYLGQLRTQATHLPSGMILQTDAPKDNQGKGEAFSPTDLMSTSLASCMLTIMGIASNAHQINIDGTRCEVEKHMASQPRSVEKIKISLYMPLFPYSEKHKEILEKAARTCPVSLSLSEKLIQEIYFHWPQ